tara:strand:- start:266 stop:478 length:213 start_codon:yes stop_codon:yes gene_type:complete
MRSHFNKIFMDFVFAYIVLSIIFLFVVFYLIEGPVVQPPTTETEIIHTIDNKGDTIMDEMDMECGDTLIK